MTASSQDVRALLARLREMECRLHDEPFLSDPDWLLLPVAKQDVVLRRLEALRRYDEIDSPTSLDALRCARDAGVAIARFYQLVSHWRSKDRAPLSLVPHQALGAERSTRLAGEETAKAIIVAIGELMRRDPLIATGKVIAHMRRTWRGPGDLPSDTALRVFHERVIRSAIPEPGTLTLNFGSQPQEQDVVAERFAETLVVDHVAIRGVVIEDDGLQPTLTLAIDLWSGSPIGAAVVGGDPSPWGVLMALQDAARRIATRRGGGSAASATTGRTRLVLATTFAPRWASMTAALLSKGFELIERQDDNLHQGGPTRRLLGMQLGPLRLDRRIDRSRPFAFDPEKTAVQRRKTLERLVSDAVDEAAERRVPAHAWAAAILREVPPLLDVVGDGDEPIVDAATSPRSIRARARKSQSGGGIEEQLQRLAVQRTPGGPGEIRMFQTADHVWHLSVTVKNPADRDAAFLRLAEGAMKITAGTHVPIVVHVDGRGDDPG